jgi:hypothetical protein
LTDGWARVALFSALSPADAHDMRNAPGAHHAAIRSRRRTAH